MVSKQQKTWLVPDKQCLSSKARITNQQIGLEIFWSLLFIVICAGFIVLRNYLNLGDSKQHILCPGLNWTNCSLTLKPARFLLQR